VPKAALPQSGPFKAGDRVVVTRSIRGVPEGTAGTIKVVDGLSWPRYWVKFDTGHWIGSISATDLVKAKDWEAFKIRRAEEAARPKVEAAPEPATVTAGDVPAAAGADSKVPAHLLERSQKARARKAAGGG
jgi:hypothetical protein